MNELWTKLVDGAKANKETLIRFGGVLIGAIIGGVVGTVIAPTGTFVEDSEDDEILDEMGEDEEEVE